jgi:hypothetical protein
LRWFNAKQKAQAVWALVVIDFEQLLPNGRGKRLAFRSALRMGHAQDLAGI